MKTSFFILLTLITSSVFSQQKRATIEKDDNIITIETSTASDSAFIICSKLLAEKGYSFFSRDQSLGQIVTSEKSYAGAYNYKLNIVCLDNSIKIRASVQLMTFSMTLAWVDWAYAKSKANLMNEAFRKFHPDITELSSRLKGSTIYYSKE